MNSTTPNFLQHFSQLIQQQKTLSKMQTGPSACLKLQFCDPPTARGKMNVPIFLYLYVLLRNKSTTTETIK